MGFFTRLFATRAPAPAPALDTSADAMRAALGAELVKDAIGLAAEVVAATPPLSASRDQVGGVPPGIGPDLWPRCSRCATPLTFVAQVGCGPDEALRYPARGAIAIFLCGAEPPTTQELCQTFDGDGSAVIFVAETTTSPPMFDPAQLGAIAAMQVAAAAYEGRRTGPPPPRFALPARAGFASHPVLTQAFRVQRRAFLSCHDPGPGPARDRYHAFLAASPQRDADVVLEVGAFPEWIQDEDVDHVCSCGAPMALVIQFEAFDDAINLGDAGRAYVFACVRRCGPGSFRLRWQCC